MCVSVAWEMLRASSDAFLLKSRSDADRKFSHDIGVLEYQIRIRAFTVMNEKKGV